MREVIALGLLALASSAQAAEQYYVSGNQLHEWCVNNLSLPYVIGVADGIGFMNQVYPETAKLCSPPEATRGQINDVVCKFIEENPEKRHYTGDQMVFLAIDNAFPCS